MASNEDYCFWAKFLMANARTANLPDILVKARTGDQLFRRRGTQRYWKGEQQSIEFLRAIGFYSLPLFLFHMSFRWAFRKSPPGLVRFVYQKLLRHPAVR